MRSESLELESNGTEESAPGNDGGDIEVSRIWMSWQDGIVAVSTLIWAIGMASSSHPGVHGRNEIRGGSV